MLLALQNVQATLAQNDADHLTNLAKAYATANTYATAQANAYATGVQHARQAQQLLDRIRQATPAVPDTTTCLPNGVHQDRRLHPTFPPPVPTPTPVDTIYLRRQEKQVTYAHLRRQGAQALTYLREHGVFGTTNGCPSNDRRVSLW